MKYFAVLSLIVLAFISCKKEKELVENDPKTTPTNTDTVQVDSLIGTINLNLTIEGNIAMLNWEVDSELGIDKFYVLKSAGNDSAMLSIAADSLKMIEDENSTFFNDTLTYLDSQLKYQICAYCNNKKIFSNIVLNNVNINNSFNYNRYGNILIDKDRGEFFILDRTMDSIGILVYNYLNMVESRSERISHPLSNPIKPIRAMLRQYDGEEELYIELYDMTQSSQYVAVFNPEKLEEIHRFGFHSCFGQISMDWNKDKIFFKTCCEEAYLYCISARTFSTLSRASAADRSNICKVIPGTNTEVLSINSSYYDDYILHFAFDSLGNLLSDSGTTNSSIKCAVFSPSGEYFIANKSGEIYDANLEYVKSITNPCPESFRSFVIDDDNRIYSSHVNLKQINCIDYSSNSLIKTYTTEGYPHKFFIDDDQLIIYSRYSPGSNYSFIEKIDL